MVLPRSAGADVIPVTPGQSINAAIWSARPGDTVLVQPGVYQEAVQLKGGVVLRAQGGPDATRLMPLPDLPVVTAVGTGSRTIDGFTIDGGYVARAGVEVDLWDDGALAISNCLILQSNGHGIDGFLTGAFARLALAGSIVAGNLGRGLILDADVSAAVIADNEFIENAGGGAAVFAADGSAVQVSRNLFEANQGDFGGGLSVAAEFGGQITATGNVVAGNTAQQGGGLDAVAFAGRITLLNNDVHQNRAGNHGGLSAFVEFGGRLDCLQNTIAQNDASDVGVSIDVFPDSAARIANDIFWGNSPMDYSGPGANHSVIASGNNGGEGNLTSDPRFYDPENGDYRLTILSPCVDGGDPGVLPGSLTTDAAGAPRVRGSSVDPGAYEFASARQLIADLRTELGDMAASGQVGSRTAATLDQRLSLADFSLRRARLGPVWALYYLDSFMTMLQDQSGITVQPDAASSLERAAASIYDQVERWGG
jgi:parallel beta helix pectate lyase-like protein